MLRGHNKSAGDSFYVCICHQKTGLPMEELDKRDFTNNVRPDEEEQLLDEVIQNDTDLYYLHHYLTELFRKGEI